MIEVVIIIALCCLKVHSESYLKELKSSLKVSIIVEVCNIRMWEKLSLIFFLIIFSNYYFFLISFETKIFGDHNIVMNSRNLLWIINM